MRTRIKAEIVIAGGGPAGSVLGLRLAQLGHDVCLLEKHRFPREHVGESLPPSIDPLLDFIGVKPAMEAAGFLRSSGAWINWDGSGVQFRETPAPGYQVDRSRFDAILLEAARSAGVRVLDSTPFDPDLIDAAIVADASGRRCLTGGVKRLTGPRSLALYAYWQRKPWPDSCSRVEALQHGWMWAAPLTYSTSIVAAFTDPTHHDKYDALLSESRLLPPSGHRGPIHVCDATPWVSESMASSNLIRVGEAAFAIDPLSSQGVQTAIASALQAAVVVHTMLCKPEHAEVAIAFYNARQKSAALRHAAIATSLYAEAAEFRGTPFWRTRAALAQLPIPFQPDSACARIVGDFVEPAKMGASAA